VEQRPQSSEPQNTEKKIVEPKTAESTTAEPTTAVPATVEPTPEEPTPEEPTPKEPTTAEPTIEEPTIEEPTTEEPTSAERSTANPTTAEPTQHSDMSIPVEDPSHISEEAGRGVELQEQESTAEEPKVETVHSVHQNGKEDPETILEEDENTEPQVESAEPQTNGKSHEAEISPDQDDMAQKTSRPTTPARQVSVNGNNIQSPEVRQNRHEREERVTPLPPKPRRSRSVRESFQAYYKVFKSRAYRNRSPPRDEAMEEELQRLRKANKTYEKQLEEASDTILLQDKVLLRWEKLSKGVSHVLIPWLSRYI
jgi:hypothetical protein